MTLKETCDLFEVINKWSLVVKGTVNQGSMGLRVINKRRKARFWKLEIRTSESGRRCEAARSRIDSVAPSPRRASIRLDDQTTSRRPESAVAEWKRQWVNDGFPRLL